MRTKHVIVRRTVIDGIQAVVDFANVLQRMAQPQPKQALTYHQKHTEMNKQSKNDSTSRIKAAIIAKLENATHRKATRSG